MEHNLHFFYVTFIVFMSEMHKIQFEKSVIKCGACQLCHFQNCTKLGKNVLQQGLFYVHQDNTEANRMSHSRRLKAVETALAYVECELLFSCWLSCCKDNEGSSETNTQYSFPKTDSFFSQSYILLNSIFI
jgi:hypothetical protein